MMKIKNFKIFKYSMLVACMIAPLSAEDELVELTAFPVQASMILRTADNFAQPVEIIGGETLNIRRAASLGETLTGLPGIADSGYYPGASRPIIRGFSNDRIRVLRNGLDLLDASVGSLDHAVAIEPFRLERIEILRGPAVLGFGGNTVGGMINVVDNLIPIQPITSGNQGYFGSQWDSASSGISLSAAKGMGSGSSQWRAGGLIRRHGDISIRGRGALDPELAAKQPEGRLENSFVHTDELALGWAMPGKQRAFGMSGSYFATRYGLGRELEQWVEGFDNEGNPIVERELDDAVSIDLKQFRWDGVMEINDLARWAESLEMKMGISDYEHSESEDGEVGTVFRSKGFEGRIEAAHRLSDRWKGVVGLQLNHSYFEAAGDEAFLRPTWTTQAGVFVFENYDMDEHQFQIGARLDYRNISPRLFERDELVGRTEAPEGFRDSAFSGSIGWVYEPLPEAALNVYLSHTQRLPNAQELYADGPHVGTFAYEISDHERGIFGRESAWSLDVGWTQRAGRFEIGIDGFISDFKDFITLRQTGEWAFENEDESFDIIGSSEVDTAFISDREMRGEGSDFLRVTRYQQTRARFFGGELQATFHIWEEARSRMSITFIADQVRATDREERVPLPRIPSRRYGCRLDVHHGSWRLQLEARHIESATRTAPREAIVGSHTLLSTYTGYEIHNGSKTILLSLRLQNLLNHQARNTTSFVKDLAPQAGRSVNLGVEVRY